MITHIDGLFTKTKTNIKYLKVGLELATLEMLGQLNGKLKTAIALLAVKGSYQVRKPLISTTIFLGLVPYS